VQLFSLCAFTASVLTIKVGSQQNETVHCRQRNPRTDASNFLYCRRRLTNVIPVSFSGGKIYRLISHLFTSTPQTYQLISDIYTSARKDMQLVSQFFASAGVSRQIIFKETPNSYVAIANVCWRNSTPYSQVVYFYLLTFVASAGDAQQLKS
jgi:hypothetical protein